MRAYAPGSITGLFAPARSEVDGTSMGVSFAITDGVTVEVTPAAKSTVTVDGDTVSFEPVTGVLTELGVTGSVVVDPSVPLGHGFGASGAATLATALAADAVFDLGRSREQLVQTSHRAELAAGTGQGDVYIQDRGGIVWSLGDGINRREAEADVEYATTGGLQTSEILADEKAMAVARRAGVRHLAELSIPPTMETLTARSRAYLEETEFATDYVEQELERVDAAGGVGSMALFGETVFAVGVDGVFSNRTAVASDGARVLER